MKKPDPLAQALAFFDRANALTQDVIPDGFFTAKQIADARGSDKQWVKLKLDRMADAGTVERREFKNRMNRPVAHYKFLAK